MSKLRAEIKEEIKELEIRYNKLSPIHQDKYFISLRIKYLKKLIKPIE